MSKIKTMKFLLKLKHWQLFLVLFIPFILSALIPLIVPKTYMFLSNLWIIIFVLWLYILSINLYREIESKKDIKTIFVIFQTIAILTMLSFLLIPFFTFLSLPAYIKTIVYVYSAIGILFSIVYCARILTLFEKKQNLLFVNLILLWFFPVGLWVIQPKIRTFFIKKGSL